MKFTKFILIFSLVLVFSIGLASAFDWHDGSLLAYYDLEESSGDVLDKTGINNGTNYGATTQATGKINYAYDFEYDDPDFIDVGSGTIDITNQNISINIWIKLESDVGGVAEGILGANTTNGYSSYFRSPTGTITLGKHGVNEKYGTLVFDVGNWHMYTITHNNSITAFYLDGLVHSAVADTNDFDAGLVYYIGNSFDGIIDELGVWNRTLSATDIYQLWNFDSGLGYDENYSAYLDFSGNIYDLDVLEYSNSQFNISVEEKILNISTITPILYCNGIPFPNGIDSVDGGVNITNFSTTINIPPIDSSVNYSSVYTFWNFNISLDNGTYYTQNSTPESQDIYDLNITINGTSCPVPYLHELYKIQNFRNETIDNRVLWSGNTPNIYTTLRYWNEDNVSEYKTIDITIPYNSADYYICAKYDNVNFPFILTTTDSAVSYTSFVERRNHKCIVANTTNSTDTFHMRNSSQDYNLFYFNVIDQYSNDVPNAIIHLERYISGVGYSYVGGYKTDNYGNAVARLVADEQYVINVYNDDDCGLEQSLAITLICPSLPCEYTISLSEEQDPFETLDVPFGFSYSFDFDSSTKILTLDYSYTGDELSKVDLNVYRRSIEGDSSVCTKTSYSDEDILTCNVSTYNSGTFIAYMDITTIDQNTIRIPFSFDLFEGKEIFGTDGLLWALLIVLVLFFAGIWNPAVAVGLAFVGLLLVAILGLASLPWLFIVLIGIIAIIIIIKLKT